MKYGSDMLVFDDSPYIDYVVAELAALAKAVMPVATSPSIELWRYTSSFTGGSQSFSSTENDGSVVALQVDELAREGELVLQEIAHPVDHVAEAADVHVRIGAGFGLERLSTRTCVCT
ncbi:MAG: hypothetical protein U0235_27985 [Polyangiaceae bacterium]